MSAAGLRYRLVTAQGGAEHVGSVVYGEEEALESLALEAHIHEAFGWRVHRDETADGYLVAVRCTRGEASRRIFARAFSPFTDSPKEATT